jgi:uncharacterized protein (TIGR04255 family)
LGLSQGLSPFWGSIAPLARVIPYPPINESAQSDLPLFSRLPIFSSLDCVGKHWFAPTVVTAMNDFGHKTLFRKPPLVETVIGLQFELLGGFRSHHYGWFWSQHLKSNGWKPVADEAALPVYSEVFDDVNLNLDEPIDSDESTTVLRFKLRSEDNIRTIQLQPDKLYLSWNRSKPNSPTFADIHRDFESIFLSFQKFTQEAFSTDLQVNLWDTTNINVIPAGPLWENPGEWCNVLPAFFPSAPPGCQDVQFATYDGDWHFEIQPKRGRIHVRVAKMVVNKDPIPVLFLMLTSRGQTTTGKWRADLDFGHNSCVRLFSSITSQKAHTYWEKDNDVKLP